MTFELLLPYTFKKTFKPVTIRKLTIENLKDGNLKRSPSVNVAEIVLGSG